MIVRIYVCAHNTYRFSWYLSTICAEIATTDGKNQRVTSNYAHNNAFVKIDQAYARAGCNGMLVYVYVWICICVYVYVCMYMCVCICKYIYIYLHTLIFISIYNVDGSGNNNSNNNTFGAYFQLFRNETSVNILNQIFVNYSNLDFTLQNLSLIYDSLPGFQPIPFHEIGLYKDRWRHR